MERTSEEADLIRRCMAGDARAYEPIVRACEGPALRVATGMLGDPDDARDAVQDAFVRAFQALDRFDAGRPFRPWLLRILRNRCNDLLRGQRRRVGLEVLDALPADHDGVGGRDGSGDAADARELIWRALGRIASEHREVLVLKELEGLRYAEIAQVAGIPEGTVASRLYHARRALRSALEALGYSGVSMEVEP
ncbi:MAG TPA: RNA polymerase sigma factor [Gemmatimonadaceae bacterium]|nr:RNA polymerase sigma factor [Gemmatimonadaceae bacterium]